MMGFLPELWHHETRTESWRTESLPSVAAVVFIGVAALVAILAIRALRAERKRDAISRALISLALLLSSYGFAFFDLGWIAVAMGVMIVGARMNLPSRDPK